MTAFNLQIETGKVIDFPMNSFLVTPEKFSEETGLTVDTIKGMISRNQVPFLKLGRRILINKAQLLKDVLAGALS